MGSPSDMAVPVFEEDYLLSKLAQTEDEWAVGAAKFGPGGLFDNLRKVYVATKAVQVRSGATEKMTEAQIDTAAHADRAYTDWLEDSLLERAEWLALDAQRSRIGMKIKTIIARGYDAKRYGG